MRRLTDLSKLGKLDIEYQRYHEFYETDDGFIVAYDIPKPGIGSAIYRPDEIDGKLCPSTYWASDQKELKALFFSDNLRKIKSYSERLREYPMEKLWITKRPLYRHDSVARAIRCDEESEFDEYERQLTKAELKVILEREKYWRERYQKRLETYWKKYSDKVYVHTYWADR